VSMQQINLLNPQLLTRRVAFSAQTMAWALLAAIVLALALDALIEINARSVRQQLDQAQNTHDKLQAKIDARVQTPDQLQASKDKLTQAVALERQRIAQLETLEKALGATDGSPAFSARLRALAHEGLPGIWLTAVEFGEPGFRLRGRAVQTAAIPDYLALLARQPALKDLPLTGFEIERPDVDGTSGLPGVAFAINSADSPGKAAK
jgi:Tfp pilus assembly protein PilN